MKIYLPDFKATPVLLGTGIAIYAATTLIPHNLLDSLSHLLQFSGDNYILGLISLPAILLVGIVVDFFLTQQKTQTARNIEHLDALKQSLSFVHEHLHLDLTEIRCVLEQTQFRHPETALPVGLIEDKLKQAEIQLKILTFLEEMQLHANTSSDEYPHLEIIAQDIRKDQ